MITTIRTNHTNSDFQELVKLLDRDLAVRDGDDHDFYHQFNSIDGLNYVIVAYFNNQPVGCGALKDFETDTMEIKRMYTLPDFRGKGVAGSVLRELEAWARELHFKNCILETGKKQPEAISLYKKSGYSRISNYGQYANVANSVCMKKKI